MTLEPRRLPLALSSSLLLVALSNADCAPSTARARPAPPSAAAAAPAPVASTPGATATPSAPDTPDAAMRPSEAALRRIIATLQRGEPVADLITVPLAETVQGPRFRGDVVNLGEVESVEYKAAGRQGFDIYEVSSKTGFSAWGIKLEADGKASGLFVRVIEKPPSKPLTEAEFASELEKRMRDAAASDEFSGVVLVARGGEPIFQKALGLADREQGIPNQLNTKFNIASMNKMFTGVAILQLVQAGKVALSDPLGKYLKGYPNADVAQQVTIEHLLTHTGGTGDIHGPEFDEHRKELRTLGDYVKLYGKRGLAFPPGSQWEYSNYGFILLGAVIEKVTGQSYYDYVAQRVYAPAGMKNTGSFPQDQNVPLRSVGYTQFRREGTPATPGAKWFPNSALLPYRGASAGGGYSTVGDLLAFANALEQHRLLDAKHTELLTTAKPGPAGAANNAYGFSDQTSRGVRCFGHGGGGPGVNGELKICRPPGAEQSFVVAALANLDPPAANRIAEFARMRLPSAPTPAATACSDLLLDDLEDGDDQSSAAPGGRGTWQSHKDVDGTTLSPEPFAAAAAGAAGSKHAARITGKTGNARGTWAGVGVGAQDSAPYDLSPWARVCFRAKGSGHARFSVADVNTSPAGGVCEQCYNNFGAPFTLTPDWQEHCVAFSEMTQAGRWGAALPAVVPAKVYSMAWSIHDRGADYDLWIDDVRLACQ
jgi:CubicO group peptidase (beta-lactamase class C family)